MKALLMAAVISVLLASGASAAIDGVLFESSAHYKVDLDPVQLCIADFDGDGINDIACAHDDVDSVAVLIGIGGGDYQPAVFYTIGTYQSDIEAVDINGDSNIDLVVATSSGVYTLIGVGDGTFGSATQISGLVNTPTHIELAIVDGDGNYDLIVAHDDGSYTDLTVWDNDGSGNFTFDAGYNVGTYQRVLAVADFDGDVSPDIAVGRAVSNNFYILINDGSGGYTVGSPTALASAPGGMCAADFDGGTGNDIAITRSGDLTIYTNDGSGNFSTGSSTVILGSGYGITPGDFDGDSDIDLAMADDPLEVFYNNGSGVFSFPNSYWVGEYSYGLAVGDLDNDSYLDLAATGLPGNGGDAPGHVAVLLNPAGNGQFMYPIQSPTGPTSWNYPVSLCRSFFDGDAYPDVATLDWVNDSVFVYLGDGAGSFTSCFRWPIGSNPCEIVAMDVDGMGTDDLIIGHSNAAGNTITVLLGVGGGIFAPPVTYTADMKPMGIFVGELNGTGLADIATFNYTAKNITVLFNQGVGTFGPPNPYPVLSPFPVNHSAIDGGDFNNDGAIDLVVPNNSAGCVQVFWNNGSGGFGAFNNVGPGMMYDPYQVHVDDLDGNGYDDIIAGSYDSCEVAVVLSSGTGFGTPTIYHAGWEQYEIRTSDFDADGNIDIVVLNTESYNFSVLFGDGLGGFAPAKHYGITSDDSEGLAVADFDNDGYTDVAVSNYNTDDISVMLNRRSILTDVEDPWVVDNLPGQYGLSQNYPNPFNPTTTIQYKLPSKADVTIAVYNLLGQRLRVFREGVQSAGTHQVIWNGRTDGGQPVSTGIYFYQLKAGDHVEAKKMLLLK